MTPREAAAMVARAIVERPRTVAPSWLRSAGRVADDAAGALLTIASSRTVRPRRPDQLARGLAGLGRYGQTPAGAAAFAAAMYPRRTALHDDEGPLTFAELDAQARAAAAALPVGPGGRVALMARNHRGFVVAAVAATRLGCDLILLNYDYAGPQLRAVLAREQVDLAIHDAEFAELFEGFDGQTLTTDDLPHAAGEARRPRQAGHVVLMTSGTTGTPKGVARGVDPSRLVATAIGGFLTLAKVKPTPRSGGAFVVAPPLFHLYGYAALMGAFVFGSPIVIRRRFTPLDALNDIERHRAEVLMVVPTMLKRIMALPRGERSARDTSSLRMVTCGAAPLAPELALAFMDEFGDVLYNAYASTELGTGTLAAPADLRAAPGTVGRAPLGVTLKILDEDGRELPRGESGRIFMGTAFQFEGYSDGTTKDVVDGLLRTGDVGHLDREGRLFIDGRDDDMILSGGENVYPQEVEDALLAHEQVADAAVLGVPDEDFGQRLAALVVLRPDAEVAPEDLRAYVGAQLARFKVPREVRFVESIPRTTTGKLMRRALAELLA